jgi:hypothetical protein
MKHNEKKASRENSHRIGETFRAGPSLQRFFLLPHNRVYVRLALSGIFAHELNLLAIGYAASKHVPALKIGAANPVLGKEPKLLRKAVSIGDALRSLRLSWRTYKSAHPHVEV